MPPGLRRAGVLETAQPGHDVPDLRLAQLGDPGAVGVAGTVRARPQEAAHRRPVAPSGDGLEQVAVRGVREEDGVPQLRPRATDGVDAMAAHADAREQHLARRRVPLDDGPDGPGGLGGLGGSRDIG